MENLNRINKFQCLPTLSEKEIKDVFSEQYEKLQAGTLKPKAIVRKLVYKTECKLLVNETRWLQGSVAGMVKKDNTRKAMTGAIGDLMKLGRTILQWDVSSHSNKSIHTIKTYWYSFKEEVLAYNISLTETHILRSNNTPGYSHSIVSTDIALLDYSPESCCLQSTDGVDAYEATSLLNSTLMVPEIEGSKEYEPNVKRCNEDKWVVDITTGELFDSVKEAATECCFPLEDLTSYLKRKDNPTCLRYAEPF